MGEGALAAFNCGNLDTSRSPGYQLRDEALEAASKVPGCEPYTNIQSLDLPRHPKREVLIPSCVQMQRLTKELGNAPRSLSWPGLNFHLSRPAMGRSILSLSFKSS